MVDTDVTMDSRKIVKRYFKARRQCDPEPLRSLHLPTNQSRPLCRAFEGWFIIDLVGSIPFEYFVGTNISGIERKAIKGSTKYLKVPVRALCG